MGPVQMTASGLLWPVGWTFPTMLCREVIAFLGWFSLLPKFFLKFDYLLKALKLSKGNHLLLRRRKKWMALTSSPRFSVLGAGPGGE